MLQFPNSFVHMTLPGIDVHLTNFFWGSILERPRRPHSHASYELVYIDSDEGMRFIINPPLYEHMNADAPQQTVKSLLFSLTSDSKDRICEAFKELTEPIELIDDFGGKEHIDSAKQYIDGNDFGMKEQATAELWMLFIKLARVIHSQSKGTYKMPSQTLDEERIARINDFFHIHLSDPLCHKAQLADYIGVSERQLSRILSEVYNMKFLTILNEMRMNLAEAMRREGRSIDEVMQLSGFTSQRTFKYNYKNFFGKPFKRIY